VHRGPGLERRADHRVVDLHDVVVDGGLVGGEAVAELADDHAGHVVLRQDGVPPRAVVLAEHLVPLLAVGARDADLRQLDAVHQRERLEHRGRLDPAADGTGELHPAMIGALEDAERRVGIDLRQRVSGQRLGQSFPALPVQGRR